MAERPLGQERRGPPRAGRPERRARLPGHDAPTPLQDDAENVRIFDELGGKNPVIVSDTADIDGAVEGVKNDAFSFSGQKCSATSRVYVHEDVIDEFTDKLVAETEDLTIGQAIERDTFVSPLSDDSALEYY